MSDPMDDSGFGVRQHADDALLGRVIAKRFTLRRCVGVGSSGTVYQADQAPLGRTVAVKVLRQDLANDMRFVRRFNDEALAASRLNHPNVVSVIDYGQTESGLLYLVMEFLRGASLTTVLRTQQLTVERVADIAGQILSALEEAHERGVVHADIKADNIVVEERRGDWDLVKVVDFGIARLVGSQDPSPDRAVCGTPEYMAPEVIRGAEQTSSSDLYSVGCVIYEMMTGATPFAGAGTMEVLRRHLEDPVLAPGKSPTVSVFDPALEAIVMRALEKPPQLRFHSASEFRLALKPLASRDRSVEQEVLCPGCGTMGSYRFKFCPECGQSRIRLLTDEGSGAAEKVRAPTFLDIAQLRPTDDFTEPLPQPPEQEHGADSERVHPVQVGILPLPLVGRERERAQVQLAITGAPRAVLLRGPSGSGRTRLLRAASETAAREDFLVYLATPDPTGGRATYHPIRSMVAAVLRLPRLVSVDALSQALDDHGLSQRELVGLAELFTIESNTWELEPGVRQRELWVATSRVLRAVTASNAVLAFEDIDEYDVPSREILRRLCVENTKHKPLRLVMTAGAHTTLDHGETEVVDLPPLSDDALRALAAHLATRGHSDLLTVDELKRRTAGDPAHIHQLVRYAVEGGKPSEAPASVPDIIAARLDLLPTSPRRLLQIVSVFGREVTREELAEVIAGGLSDQGLDDSLLVLAARDLVRIKGSTISFERRVIRDVVYEGLPADVRRDLHRTVGDVVSASSADPALLGHHALAGGETERASLLLSRAGDNAMYQMDEAAASSLYNDALSAARERMLSHNSNYSRSQFVTIAIKLADTLVESNELSLARGVLEEAQGYCSESSLLVSQLWRARSHVAVATGDDEAALRHLRDAIGLAIPAGLTDLLCELYLDVAALHLRGGRMDRATEELQEGLDLVSLGEGAKVVTGPRKLWQMVLRLAQLVLATGDGRRAQQLAQEAHRLANGQKSEIGAAKTQATLAEICDQEGEPAKAEVYRSRAVDIMRRLGDRRGTAELLLAGARPSSRSRRITPGSVREARLLAEEIGWKDGATRAKRVSEAPPPEGKLR